MRHPRRKARRIFSAMLAALMCVGLLPSAAQSISAANYQVHTSNDLVKTANETESDDAGDVLNTAIVYGTDIRGTVVDDTDDAETVIASEPKIQIIKNVDKTMLKNASAGDELVYTFEVTNTGKVTLSNLVFGDTRELEGLTWDASLDSLAVGGVLNGRAVLHITQADIDAGKIVNCADITGTAPDGTTVTDDDDVTTTIVSEPAIHLMLTGIRCLL